MEENEPETSVPEAPIEKDGEDGGDADSAPGRARRWLSVLGFLKPSNPQEALALFLLCSALVAAGAGAVKTVESIFAEDPWRTRADQICLRAGNEFVSVEEEPVEQMQTRIEITSAALSGLVEVGDSVPLESTLAYQSMLDDKRAILALLERKLSLIQAKKRTESVENRIRGELEYSYGPAAEELDLSVCGQSTGRQ